MVTPTTPSTNKTPPARKDFLRKAGSWEPQVGDRVDGGFVYPCDRQSCMGILWLQAGSRRNLCGQDALRCEVRGSIRKVGRRLSQHVKSGKISRWQATTAKVYRVKCGKTRREVAEQHMIDKLRKRGKRLEDIVNPIGVRRKHLMSSTPKNWRGL